MANKWQARPMRRNSTTDAVIQGVLKNNPELNKELLRHGKEIARIAENGWTAENHGEVEVVVEVIETKVRDNAVVAAKAKSGADAMYLESHLGVMSKAFRKAQGGQ